MRTNMMTEDEHRARAMLLGMYYDHQVHCYIELTGQTRHFDAETLEEISFDATVKRQMIYDARSKDAALHIANS